MSEKHPPKRHDVRYQPDETPPVPLSIGLGLQLAVLSIAAIVLTPAIIARAALASEAFLTWSVFMAVVVSGTLTIVQAVKVGRVGAGYVLLMGTSGAFIAVCIAALAQGGPAMMATLVVISSLFQFALASRLSLLRRILTPTVSGTVVMLIPVTVIPIVFDMLKQVPEGTPSFASPICAAFTLGVVIAIALKAKGTLRLWAPVIGIGAGSIVSGFLGLYEVQRIAEAAWIGLPSLAWPGFDFSFGAEFWALLPAFVLVTLVGAIETIGDSVAIQRVSWKTPRAVDYKAVQGAVTADGLGNLLSGLAGTVPNTTYSSTVAVTELTGVAARSVGVVIGIAFIGFAFLPKFLALILAIPSPVVASFLIVILALLFMIGIKMVVHDASDYRTGIIAGLSFWIGVGFQSGQIYGDFFAEFAGGLLQNGMTAGGLAAIAMTLFVELTQSRRQRLEVPLTQSSIGQIHGFLEKFATASGWDSYMANRIQLAAEEAVISLLERGEEMQEQTRNLLLTAHKTEGRAELELIASTTEGNLEDSLTMLEDLAARPQDTLEDHVSLKILRHLTSSIRHQQYHGIDVLVLQVDPPSESKETA